MKIDFKVLEETKHFLVVNKPPFVYSQPPSSTNKKFYTNTLLYHLQRDRMDKLYPVQRLDFNVSGAICFAKSLQAAQNFSKHLRAKLENPQTKKGYQITRKYLCLTEALNPLETVPQISGTVDTEIDGKAARTDFKTLYTFANGQKLVLAKLSTGRKHQIREHLQSLNHIIIGDYKYGFDRSAQDVFLNSPIALHSTYLYLKVGMQESRIFAPLVWNHNNIWDILINEGIVDLNGSLVAFKSDIENF